MDYSLFYAYFAIILIFASNGKIYPIIAISMNAQIYLQYNTVVAIDPDVERNGVACLDVSTRNLKLQSLRFPETIEYLHSLKSKESVVVIIEAGWLNKSHWHSSCRDSKANAAAKGNAVGRNHEVGRKLGEMCEYWKIPYRLKKPLALRVQGRNIWQGKDGKITAEEFKNVTGYKDRSNQEERDAGLLAWVTAKLPIKIKKEGNFFDKV